jgi:hypothetical protein
LLWSPVTAIEREHILQVLAIVCSKGYQAAIAYATRNALIHTTSSKSIHTALCVAVRRSLTVLLNAAMATAVHFASACITDQKQR